MIASASILDFRSGFELAAFFVTWVAIAFIALIAVSLHLRLQRLERIDLQQSQAAAFSQLLGKTVHELSRGFVPSQPCLILFLSPLCSVCERVLAELQTLGRDTLAAIVWTSSSSAQLPTLPPHVLLVPEGPSISATLGIRVTPFALVADEHGVVIQALPVNSLAPLRDALEPSRKVAMLSRFR